MSAASGVFTLGDHGFSEGDPVVLRPAGDGSLPVELSEDATYYASPLSDSRFRVKASLGGSAVTFTDAEDYSIVVVCPLPFDSAIAWAEEVLNDMMPAHVMPIESGDPVPRVVQITAAELAAWKVSALQGSVTEPLTAIFDRSSKRIERWAKGVPLRDDDAPKHTAVATPVTAQYVDRRGWGRFGSF